MKICVSGVHGIGKTSLVKWISEKYNLPLLSEQARFLLDTEYPFEIVNTDLSVFMDFQNHVLDNQKTVLEGQDNFVTDRSPIDSLSYVLERLGAERYLFPYYYQNYLERALSIIETLKFDHIFFIEFDIEDHPFWKNRKDGQRDLSPMYMKSLNNIMKSLYEEIEVSPNTQIHNVPFFQFEERKDFVRTMLRSLT